MVWEGPKQNNIIHEQPRFLYVVRRLEDTLFVVRRCIVCKYKMFCMKKEYILCVLEDVLGVI